ncbi:hypothetical protein ABNB97_03835 [Paenibacillus larvae]
MRDLMKAERSKQKMSNVVFSASSQSISNLVQRLVEGYDDSVLVLAPFAGEASTYAPPKKGKYKGYYRLELNVLIPEDAIKGEDCLNDFAAFAVVRLPKERVQDHLWKEE